jgi:hemolysin activation/secretion protein
MKYQVIRQRQENLAVSLMFDGRNAHTDIQGSELSNDHVRAVRGGVTYDTADRWDGYNSVTATLSQGIGVLGASRAGDLNLSRAQAEADFTRLEWQYNRQQFFGQEVMLIGQLAGQVASGALYSSEEFGFGGSDLGRGYDTSEITGDHGVAAGVEMRYLGIPDQSGIGLAPYLFYDIGKVWNEDSGAGNASASSAGLGLRLSHESGLYSSLGVAFPLTRAVDAPLYGNGKNPRLMFQMGYNF